MPNSHHDKSKNWSRAAIIDRAKQILFIVLFVVGPVVLIIAFSDGSPRYGDKYDHIRR